MPQRDFPLFRFPARRILLCCFFALAPSLSSAQETIAGEFWKASRGLNNIDTAIAETVGSGMTPTATFQSTGVDYPKGPATTHSGKTRLIEALGVDAPSIAGAGEQDLRRSLFRFTGFVDVTPGPHTFTVGSDQGMRLLINGDLIVEDLRQNGYGETSITADIGFGHLPFELYYYENNGDTGIEFKIDGQIVRPAQKAVLEASKSVSLHSESGLGCADLTNPGIAEDLNVFGGACMEYLISLSNAGAGTSYQTLLTDTFGPDLIFMNAEISGVDQSDPDYAFTAPLPMSDCNVVLCEMSLTNGILKVGDTATIRVRVLLRDE